MRLIPARQYRAMIENLPILCVDIVLQDSRGRYLLVKRTNPPKKNRWWVIGGRVLKGETLFAAVRRKARQEAGLAVTQAQPVGYYELRDALSPFGGAGRYHTVSVVFKVTVPEHARIRLDRQSCAVTFARSLPADFIIKPWRGTS